MSDALPDFDDKIKLLAHAAITVGVTEVQAKAGVSLSSGVEFLAIYNDSNNTIFYGLTGVSTSGPSKGWPLIKGQWANVPCEAGDSIFLIASTPGNSVLVYEWGN